MEKSKPDIIDKIRNNIGVLITLGGIIAGVISGYTLLQYRVDMLERRMNNLKIEDISKRIEDEIEKSKYDFNEERIYLRMKIAEIEARLNVR
jgi:hypothetical protein